MPISRRKLTELALLAVFAFGVYQTNVFYQSHLGRQAIAATGLDSLELEQALEQSELSDKPVLVELAAVWCPSCRALDRKVLSNRSVQQRIEQGYHFVRLEYESEAGEAFMARHGVRGYPKLFVLDAQGEITRQLPLTLDPRVFEQRLLDGAEAG
jgi:thiol:disulfide interchange protein